MTAKTRFILNASSYLWNHLDTTYTPYSKDEFINEFQKAMNNGKPLIPSSHEE